MTMKNNTMRAWMHTSKNMPLERGMTLVEDAPYPSDVLKPTEALVRVKSVGINPADATFAEMVWPARALIKPNPIAGMDFSGEIVSAGRGITSMRPGERVFGRANTEKGKPGSMAEYVKIEMEGCVPMPPDLDWDQAAGVGTAGITAYDTLVLNSKPGDSVFINGGSGGVGTFAIQFAKAHGCRVTASCSTTKVDLCEALGADEVINYRTEDLVAALRRGGRVFDLVVDYAYQEEVDLYRASGDFLADGGTFVMVPGGTSGAMVWTLARNTLCPAVLGGGRANFKTYFARSNRAALRQISEWIAAGKVRTVIDSVLEFEEMPKAIERIKSGRSTGKIIVHV